MWRKDSIYSFNVEKGQHVFTAVNNNNNNKRPLTPKSMPPTGDEHAKLKI